MSENYPVYRRNRKRKNSSRQRKKTILLHKLYKQTAIATVILSFIYLSKSGNTSVSKIITHSVKSALNYNINTQKIRSEITTAIDNVINIVPTHTNGEKGNGQTQENQPHKNQ